VASRMQNRYCLVNLVREATCRRDERKLELPTPRKARLRT
jgi:hypothetical protein